MPNIDNALKNINVESNINTHLGSRVDINFPCNSFVPTWLPIMVQARVSQGDISTFVNIYIIAKGINVKLDITNNANMSSNDMTGGYEHQNQAKSGDKFQKQCQYF